MRKKLLHCAMNAIAVALFIFALPSQAVADEIDERAQGAVTGETSATALAFEESAARSQVDYDNVSSYTGNYGLTLKISWNNPKCGEPTTFHLEGSGGSGAYAYMLNAVNLFNSDTPYSDYDAEAVTDASLHSQNGYAYQESGDISFTFMASGYYRMDFYVSDPGNEWRYTRFFLRVKVEDPQYPTIPAQIEEIASRCLAEGNTTDFDKAVWMHDWLIGNMDYDNSLLYCGHEGAFLRGKGTCETYHRAYSKLLAAVGVESGRIEGNGHVWTAVKMDGKWCHVDATWNDTSQLAGYPDLRHLYFGMSDYVAGLVHPGHASPLAGYEAPSLENHYLVKSGQVAEWANPYVDAFAEGLASGSYQFSVPIEHASWPPNHKNVLYNLVAYDLQNRAWKVGATSLKIKVSYGQDALDVKRLTGLQVVSDKLPAGAQLVYSGRDQVGVSTASSQMILSGTTHALNAGTYVAQVVPASRYAWSSDGDMDARSISWSIQRAPISSAVVAGIQTSYAETGSALSPKPKVTFNGATLKEGVDYTLSYANNVKPGSATLAIAGKGNFAGTRAVGFAIAVKPISEGSSGNSGGATSGGASAPSPKWVKDKGVWYLRTSDGSNLKGWQKVGGRWFYLDPSTGVMKTGWQKIGGGWYYLTPGDSGAMKTGWQKIGGRWYYLTPGDSGRMKTGWQKIGGAWYYLTPGDSGAMKTRWQKIGGRWYYLTPGDSGRMVTGWQTIGGKQYYFLPGDSGVMVTGWQAIGGKRYLFSSSGARIR